MKWWAVGMGFREALDLLGIRDDASPKEARRAYLRKVKVHKPERDPEGFQRVRHAYELVSPVLAIPKQHRYWDELGPDEKDDAPRASEGPTASTPVAGSDGDTGAREPEHAADEAPADEARARDEAVESGDDEFDDEFNDEFDDDDSLLAPYQAPPQQLREWLTTAYPKLLAAFESAADHPAHSLPVWGALQAMAILVVDGDWQRARPLAQSIDRWQREIAGRGERLANDSAARWALLSEMAKVGPGIHHALLAPIAAGLLDDNPNRAALELRQCQQLFPDEATRALSETKHSAPVLHAVLADHLAEQASGYRRRGFGGGVPYWPVLVGLFFVFNGLRTCSNPEPRYTLPSAAILSSRLAERAPPERRRVPDDPPRAQENRERSDARRVQESDDPPRAQENQARATEIVERARERLAQVADTDDLRKANARMYDAFSTGECSRMGPALATLEYSTRAYGSDVRDEVQRYWAEYLIACPGQKLPEAGMSAP